MADATLDPASLERLHDIVAPGPTPWWPPAPGWYILGILVLFAGLLLLIQAVCRWRSNRYRREALAQLALIRPSRGTPDETPTAIAELAELLKRVALAAWPRETVAPLSGQRWLAFIRATGRGETSGPMASLDLTDIAYCRKLCEQLSPAQVEQLFVAAGDWIKHHQRAAADANPRSSAPRESN